CGCGLRFALKTGQCLRIAGNVFRQESKRDKTMKPPVLGFVDHPHAPAPEFLDNAVMRDGLADHWRECYVAGIRKSMNPGNLAVCQNSRGRNIVHSTPRNRLVTGRVVGNRKQCVCWRSIPLARLDRGVMLNLPAYLERIGYSGSTEPSAVTLRALHRAHMFAVPFENLDIHIGRPIVCDEA